MLVDVFISNFVVCLVVVFKILYGIWQGIWNLLTMLNTDVNMVALSIILTNTPPLQYSTVTMRLLLHMTYDTKISSLFRELITVSWSAVACSSWLPW